MKKNIAALLLIVLSSLSAFSQTVTVKHNSNLRKSATVSSAILEEIQAGSEVSLISKIKRSGYYHVRAADGAVGWILAKNVTSLPTPQGTPSPAPSVSPAPGQAFDAGCALPFDPIKQKHSIIDDSCSIDGTSSTGGKPNKGKLAENHAKNNFCLTGAPVDISYDDLLKLQRARQNVHDAVLTDAAARTAKLTNVITVNGQEIGEGTLVRLVIYVLAGKADYADTAEKHEKGESVNCYRLSNEENDIHIPLGLQTEVDECLSVTAEMSPHFRPAKWTPENINSVGGHPVRITGQLFYDSSHTVCKPGKAAAPKRASLWEIHPVYAIEVCTTSTDIDQCKAAPESTWQPLDQFTP